MSCTAKGPCAACKCRRQKCTQECIFAPYFPADDPQKFDKVHKIFGASNVAKILHELPPEHRLDAANSLAFEAQYRIHDPIYGCIGLISALNTKLDQVRLDLQLAKNELDAYYMRHYNYLPPHEEQLRSFGGVDFIADFNNNHKARTMQPAETSHQIQTQVELNPLHHNSQFYPKSWHGVQSTPKKWCGSFLREQVQSDYPQHERGKNEQSGGLLLREQVQSNLHYYPHQKMS
ncbi:hypothetical protein ACS0TY_006185 [Phlomoides rotata]